VRFLAGRHALIPFARPDDAGAVLDVCQSFVLDNSAFSLWKKGGDVDVAGYHAWVESLAGHPGLDWCLIPDKIDGTEAENADLVTLWQRIGCRVLSVPVWHMHESLEYLDYLCRNWQVVALGSSGQWRTPGTPAWWQRMAEAMKTACDEKGGFMACACSTRTYSRDSRCHRQTARMPPSTAAAFHGLACTCRRQRRSVPRSSRKGSKHTTAPMFGQDMRRKRHLPSNNGIQRPGTGPLE